MQLLTESVQKGVNEIESRLTNKRVNSDNKKMWCHLPNPTLNLI